MKWTPVVFVIILLTFSMVLPISTYANSDEPNNSTYFKYRYRQKVSDGSGAYYEYTERTKGEGKYDVISWNETDAVMRAKYSWKYSNNEGKRDSAKVDREFSFSIGTRNYTSPQIDLDDEEYEGIPPNRLAQWLWIPPDVEEGDQIRILDDTWTITNTDKTLWSRFVARKVIEVVTHGTGSRNDDYGVFSYTFTDKLYFEKESGMFFAERYEEFDKGHWEGQSASFRYYIDIDVTKSSYEVEIDWLELILWYTFVILLGFIIIGGSAYLIYRGKYIKREFQIKEFPEMDGHLPTSRGEKVVFRRVWKMRDFPHLENNATDHFGPFLEHWTKKSLLAKDRVVVAVSERYDLIGYAMYNKEAKIGTILCKNTEITEIMRGFIGCKDFFSERRHKITITKEMRKYPDVMRKIDGSNKEAYNVFETHTVYRLNGICPTNYDTKLVRPMKQNDLKEVSALAKKVYNSRAKRWIRACFRSGELAYVAQADGKIVGFGFACVAGTHGRLHTLGVSKEHRGRGIAKELHRARLEAMRLMGVETVIDEIGDWNLASKRISILSGFTPVGEMFVETSRSKRIKKNIVRR